MPPEMSWLSLWGVFPGQKARDPGRGRTAVAVDGVGAGATQDRVRPAVAIDQIVAAGGIDRVIAV